MGSFSNLFGKFKLLDFMSKEIRLNIDGHHYLRTWLGFGLSLIYLGAMVTTLVIVFNNYFKNDNPTTYSETYVGTDAPTMDLKQDSFLPFIYAFDSSATPIPADSLKNYFTFSFYVFVQNTTLNPDGSVNQTFDFIDFEVLPCSNLTQEQWKGYSYMKPNDLAYARMMSNGICIGSNRSVDIVGEKTDNIFKRLYVEVYPCTQGASCVNLTELTSMYYLLVTPISNTKPKNKYQPVEFSADISAPHWILPNIMQSSENKLQVNQVMDYTDVKFLPQWVTRQTYIDIEDTIISQRSRSLNFTNPKITCDSIYDDDCLVYFRSIYLSSPKLQIRYRKYVTLLDSFGTIGGINALLMGFLGIIYTFYEFKILQNNLADRLFKTAQFQKLVLKKSPSGLKYTPVEQGSVRSYLQRMNCFRKKTEQEIEQQKVRQLALGSINSNMGIESILRELQYVRALCHMMFTPEQLSIIPWLELSDAYLKQQNSMRTEVIDYEHLVNYVEVIHRDKRLIDTKDASSPEGKLGFQRKYNSGTSSEEETASLSFKDLVYKYWGAPEMKPQSLFTDVHPQPVPTSNKPHDDALTPLNDQKPSNFARYDANRQNEKEIDAGAIELQVPLNPAEAHHAPLTTKEEKESGLKPSKAPNAGNVNIPTYEADENLRKMPYPSSIQERMIRIHQLENEVLTKAKQDV